MHDAKSPRHITIWVFLCLKVDNVFSWKLEYLKKYGCFFALQFLTIVDITNRVDSSFKKFIIFSNFFFQVSFPICPLLLKHFFTSAFITLFLFFYHNKNLIFKIFIFYFWFCIWARKELKLKVKISYLITSFSFFLFHIKSAIQLIMSNSLSYFGQFIIFLLISNLQINSYFFFNAAFEFCIPFRMHVL